ncbi:MAG: hypothetical protein CMA71_01710 [Euryarchaeota archaeon]|nr:hypothetical protein [Euryarchaeota archaeon]
MVRNQALALVLLMILQTVSATVGDSGYEETPRTNDHPDHHQQDADPLGLESSPWFDPVLLGDDHSVDGKSRVTVVTNSLQNLEFWQIENGALEEQAEPGPGESLVQQETSDGRIDHRTFWIDSDLIQKIPGIRGVIAVIDAQRAPEPYSIEPFDKPNFLPATVTTGELHGATDAWAGGYSGEGLIVAVADTGVDFAHPDLNGTQARVTFQDSPYFGWPLMLDHSSMYSWMVHGEAYPERSSWYADTSIIDIDNNSDGLLDDSGLNITGVNISISGDYHIGEHPDPTLRSRQGGDVSLLVVDDQEYGHYKTVYADLDRDGEFGDEVPMRPGEETSGLDTNGDGLWDVSGGLVYWVSDGKLGVPYGNTYAARHGYSDRIAGPGNLTLFMLESGSHGTLCASAISAQGVVSEGKVLGMAPNATISSIGNHYSGGHSLDAWRFIAEGYDGHVDTPDQPNIGSFSFGYSSVDEAGADAYSLYLDWLTRFYNENTSYAVAIGNGGHGFGTTKSPGASNGVFSVGAFSSRSSGTWGQIAPWSNRGPNALGRMDPDVVAVGWSATGDIPLNSMDDANSAWRSWGGTSLATPVAAGLMALVAEAWMYNLGDYPNSQEFRDLVMSTSDDRGYEPFTQGGGWFNVSKATKTLDGENGTWWATPSHWNSGTFQGQHRDANLNLLRPGEVQITELEFTNPGDSEISLQLSPTSFSPLSHEARVWNSTGNGTEDGENSSWDGYQSSRPDLLIPLHLRNDSNTQLNPETRQLRARATIDYSHFDNNQDRDSEERVFLEIMKWEDEDQDGIYVLDLDNDSMVDSEDWTEEDELKEVTYWRSDGPNAEVRMGNPFQDSGDGLMLAVWNYNGQLSDEPVRIEIDWTTFGTDSDEWISVPSEIILQPNESSVVPMTISVPVGADPGLHQHGLLISSNVLHPNGTFIQSSNNRYWTLPVVTNVPWVGPFSLNARPLDGNVTNQTLYSEEWISGATRWDWRAESGDWRFLSIEWPEEWATGGTAVIDVDWEDNPYTDIDVMWLSETTHGYSSENSTPYGNSTFFIEERSTNNYAGSGSHNWGTYTGGSREVFAVPVTPGVHQLALHTALHGVNSNDNALNISVGYIAAEKSGFERVVTDWNDASGVEAVHLVSTVPLPIESVNSFGWSQPINLYNESVSQDTRSDKMTASWWKNLTINNSESLSIEIDAEGHHSDSDIDLYLFRDSNGDGVFSSEEEIEKSTSGDSSEKVEISNLEDGLYGIAVHGYDVPRDSINFWISIDEVGGSELRVTNQMPLSDNEISSIWPNGSVALAGESPSAAIQLSLEFDRPNYAGTWQGFVDVELVGGIEIRLPYTYELVELDPEVKFVEPKNMSHHNQSAPILIHAIDRGIGFRLDQVNLSSTDNQTEVPDADLVQAIDTLGNHHNLTTLWNYGNHSSIPENLTFREIWINSTLPEIEKWHDYMITVTDISGLYAQDFLSVSYDITSPEVSISNIPVITQNPVLTYQIWTEPGTTLTHSGIVLELDDQGMAEHSFLLDKAEIGFDESSNSPYYFINGSSVFTISVFDEAGNSITREFQVIFDPDPPSNSEFLLMNDQDGNYYASQDVRSPVNLTSGTMQVEIPSDTKSWCLSVHSSSGDYFTEECSAEISMPTSFNTSMGHPEPHEQGGEQEYYSTILPLSTTGLPDGDYTILLELTDWANSTASDSWPISIDKTVPSVQWATSPSYNKSLFDHRQEVSWSSSEPVIYEFTVDGEQIIQGLGESGLWPFQLSETGIHELCLYAVDETQNRTNSNYFIECRTMELNSTIYDTLVIANWNGGIVSSEEVIAKVQLGPDQIIRWSEERSDGFNLVIPSSVTEDVIFVLREGENKFTLEVDSLNETDIYHLAVVRDTISPAISIEERVNRTSTLSNTRIIQGICERGANVLVWSEIDSSALICPSSGMFSVEIDIVGTPGEHDVHVISSDFANNEASSMVTVLKQDWPEWAIDDARDMGPMLGWFSLAGLIVAVCTLLLTRRIFAKEGGTSEVEEDPVLKMYQGV